MLKDVEDINHNTKKFVFQLPENDMVSGLDIASALLTKFVPEGQKAVLRPYTPISDEGTFGTTSGHPALDVVSQDAKIGGALGRAADDRGVPYRRERLH